MNAKQVTLNVKLGRGQVDITEVEVVSPNEELPGGTESQHIPIAVMQTDFNVTVKIYGGINSIIFITRGIPDTEVKDIQNTWQGTGATAEITEKTLFTLEGKIRPVVVLYSKVLDFPSPHGSPAHWCTAGYQVFDGYSPKDLNSFKASIAGTGMRLDWSPCKPEFRCAYPVDSVSHGHIAYESWYGGDSSLLPGVVKDICRRNSGTYGGRIITEDEIIAQYLEENKDVGK